MAWTIEFFLPDFAWWEWCIYSSTALYLAFLYYQAHYAPRCPLCGAVVDGTRGVAYGKTIYVYSCRNGHAVGMDFRPRQGIKNPGRKD